MTESRYDDYVSLTETSGDEVTAEQVARLARRYRWAAEYCRGRRVLEAACGTGQGVGLLGSVSASVVAGDWSPTLVASARAHYRDRYPFCRFDAQAMPFASGSLDVVILFEALYYLPEADRFLRECRRVLTPGGVVLIATANPDLFDFNPSPRSYKYFGVVELREAFGALGFATTFFGDTPIGTVSARQRILRPVKAMASRLRLIPKSADGKKFLKRLVFGGLVEMPAEVTADQGGAESPVPIAKTGPDKGHKVILCAARLEGEA